MSPFGYLVQDWMDRTGQSLRQLAVRSGVDRSKISAYMSGEPGNRIISPDQADALASTMHVPEDAVHEAVALARGYKLRTVDIAPRLRVLLSMLDGLDDRQLAAVEATAVAVSNGR